MKTRPIAIFIAWLFLVLGVNALPIPAAEPVRFPSFSEIDKNRDGYISIAEAKTVHGLQVYLSTLDQNSDSRLSREEYESLKVLAPDRAEPTPFPPPESQP
ncbi:putative orphan protein [Methylocaldum marinum]|uniref:Putative orphan protein n=1 Tax=Methylocaldum marinum TaxID=1432792 RepID=A0A250KMA4_9GAMM|nr:EF-hand domain-containing protein [Methylocaldum marinum]BBA32686.1 putative orphan protein [Methylocaldum marinum]